MIFDNKRRCFCDLLGMGIVEGGRIISIYPGNTVQGMLM